MASFILSPYTNDYMKDPNNFDVLIIGGSYAGLSAALSLGRSLRTVLIIDSGSPCNQKASHAHNFITHDGTAPHLIAEKARAQVLQYPSVTYRNDLAVSASATDTGFTVRTDSGHTFTAKKLILATGIKDKFPDIDGFAACWGISVIHCPYCHGYEHRGQITGIMANGPLAMHLALLLHNLTNKLSLMTCGKADLTPEQISQLQQHGIPIVETAITSITHHQGQVKQVVFADGSREEVDVLYAALPFTQHTDLAATLGCSFTEQGHIKVDMFQKTSIEGVYACGDSTMGMRSIAYASASGNLAGAMVNHALAEEVFQ